MGFLNITGAESGDLSEVLVVDGSPTASTTIKRTGAYAYRVNNNSAAQSFAVRGIAADGSPANLGRTSLTYFVFYLYIDDLPTTSWELASVTDSSSGAGTNLRLRVENGGGASFRHGATEVSLGAGVFTTNTWYRVEIEAVSAGTCKVYIDGVPKASLTAGSFTIDRIIFGMATGASVLGSCYIDDIAISDHSLIGAGEVRILKPNATGNYTAWTNGAGTAPTNVAEVPHNSDTGYISSSTSGQAETEALDSAATGGVQGTIGTVKAVAIVRDEGGSSAVQVRIRGGTTDVDTSSSDPGSSYVARCMMRDTNPADSAAWENSDLDAMEIGVDNAASVAVRCTALYAMVWCAGTPPPKDILASGIASAEAFGSTLVSIQQFLGPDAIDSEEAFGEPLFVLYVEQDGSIDSAEAFGDTEVRTVGSILPPGIASAEAFGSLILVYDMDIAPDGIASGEDFGSAAIGRALIPVGILSGEAFGDLVLIQDLFISPAGIASGEAFGLLVLARAQEILAEGIASGEQFSLPVIVFFVPRSYAEIAVLRSAQRPDGAVMRPRLSSPDGATLRLDWHDPGGATRRP